MAVLGTTYLPTNAVTQITSLTTGVTINGQSGVITTFNAATGAAAAGAGFTVTNNAVLATSSVVATICNYSGTYGTNGFPMVYVQTVADGAFNIIPANLHASNALNGVLKIAFTVT